MSWQRPLLPDEGLAIVSLNPKRSVQMVASTSYPSAWGRGNSSYGGSRLSCLELFLKTCSFSLFSTKQQLFSCIKIHLYFKAIGWIRSSNLNPNRYKERSWEEGWSKHEDLPFADENTTHRGSYQRRSLFPIEEARVWDYEMGGLAISSLGLCTGKRAWAVRRFSPYDIYTRGALNLARNRRKICCRQR